MPPPAGPPNAAPWPEDHEPTPFQAAVARAVADLRPGDVATYGEIAEQVGRPGAGQAVANVLRQVPDLPWWRVVPASGRLYCSHLSTQGPLLEAEGHRVDDQRRIVSAALSAAAGSSDSASSRGRRRRSA